MREGRNKGEMDGGRDGERGGRESGRERATGREVSQEEGCKVHAPGGRASIDSDGEDGREYERVVNESMRAWKNRVSLTSCACVRDTLMRARARFRAAVSQDPVSQDPAATQHTIRLEIYLSSDI